MQEKGEAWGGANIVIREDKRAMKTGKPVVLAMALTYYLLLVAVWSPPF